MGGNYFKFTYRETRIFMSLSLSNIATHFADFMHFESALCCFLRRNSMRCLRMTLEYSRPWFDQDNPNIYIVYNYFLYEISSWALWRSIIIPISLVDIIEKTSLKSSVATLGWWCTLLSMPHANLGHLHQCTRQPLLVLKQLCLHKGDGYSTSQVQVHNCWRQACSQEVGIPHL